MYALMIVAAGTAFVRSFVPKFMSTTSVGCPLNQVARSAADDTNGSLLSAPPGLPVLVALSTSVTMVPPWPSLIWLKPATVHPGFHDRVPTNVNCV